MTETRITQGQSPCLLYQHPNGAGDSAEAGVGPGCQGRQHVGTRPLHLPGYLPHQAPLHKNCQASLAGSGVAYIPIRELWQVTHELSITHPHQCLPLRGLCPPRVSAL